VYDESQAAMSIQHEIPQETPRPIRILGLPLQFVTVFIITVSLVIFFGGWAAQNSVEGRWEQTYVPAMNESINNGLVPGPIKGPTDVDKTWWEDAALFVCPAH
jgi:hypothetical protein